MSNAFVKNKKKTTIKDTFKSIASSITAVFVFVILGVFPLYTHDKYFDILGARYVFFKLSTVILLLLLVILGFLYIIIDSRSMENDKPTISRLIDAIKIQNLYKYVNWCDVAFLVMIISMALGTLGAHHTKQFDLLKEAFYGNAGRYQGLECWIIYFVMYVCVSRTYEFKKWHLNVMIVACSLASLWSITDFYMMDIFGYLANVSELQKHQFSSSIGNLNTLTNYTCMGLGVAITLFIQEKKLWKEIFYAICALICLLGNIFGMSDNAAIGTMAIYIALPFFAVRTKGDFLRYIFSIVLLFLGINIGYIGSRMPNAAGGWGLNSVFFDVSKVLAIRMLLWVFLAGFIFLIYFYRKKSNAIDKTTFITSLDLPVYKKFMKIWTIIIICGFLLIIYVFIDVNVLHIFGDKLLNLFQPVRNFLVFNDDWGTHRGHNWRIAFENFSKFNPYHKIFGYGGDTYLVLTERTYYHEMINRYGEVYDSAHNEYVHYLICEGILGLTAYISIIITSIYYGIKKLKDNKFIAACILGVIAYAAQAIVNIAIPITTPIYFCLLYMIVAQYQTEKEIE